MILCFFNYHKLQKRKPCFPTQASEQREDSCMQTISVCVNTCLYALIKYLSIPFTVKELEDNSLPSVVRIPKSYVSKPVMPMAPVSKGSVFTSVSCLMCDRHNSIQILIKFIIFCWTGSAKSVNRKIVEEEKQNIRASSVPRPRAVLSSPGTFLLICNFSAFNLAIPKTYF